MNNWFMDVYQAWPLKVFIIHNDSIKWTLEPDKPGLFRFEDIEEAIDSLIKNKTCDKGHPLTLTKPDTLFEHDKGYVNGYICDECEKEDKSASYHCGKCFFDLCQKCYENKESNCPGKHGLNKYNSSKNGQCCNVCRTKMAKDSVLYGCKVCDFDLCINCIKVKK